MKKVLFFVGALAFVPSTLFAQDRIGVGVAYGLGQCSHMTEDFLRLSCYDVIVEHAGLGVSAEGEFAAGWQWEVEVGVDPIDDTPSVSLLVLASPDSGASVGNRNVYFSIGCRRGLTSAFIDWDDYLGDKTIVTSRIGEEKAKVERWNISTSNTASFHPRPIPFIKEMLGHDVLAARTAPYDEGYVTAIFDIRGLDAAIAPLREACGW